MAGSSELASTLGGRMVPDETESTIRCPHCGEEIVIDETIADRLVAAVEASGSGKILQLEDENTKLKAQLVRLSNDLTQAERRTRTGSPTEEGYARQDRVVPYFRGGFQEMTSSRLSAVSAGPTSCSTCAKAVRNSEQSCGKSRRQPDGEQRGHPSLVRIKRKPVPHSGLLSQTDCLMASTPWVSTVISGWHFSPLLWI